jgi:UDP:flavonoid glycosyltransferase YjiC (YdhE family)
MPKILFFPDVYQEQGHWHPAISLAQALNEKGHETKFMGIADCKSIVEPYVSNINDSFINIFEKEYPFGYTKSNQHRSVSERWKPVHLWNIINGGIEKAWGEFRPDLIISGYFASLETLLIHYKYDINFMILTTYLRHPDDDPGIRAIQNLVGMSEPMSRKIMSECSDILDIHDFVKPLEAATELVPCPRKFEFDNYVFDTDINPDNGRVQFIEPCVSMDILNETNASKTAWEKSNAAGKLGSNKIIFATAGSQTQDYKDKARRWFQEMVKMMSLPGMQDYYLIMSVGSDLCKEDWCKELPSNASAHSWVPQSDVLNHSVAAYIHGGLATIKECICKGVPFIVLPLGKDQMDNALRVRRKGIAQIAYAEATDFKDLQNLFLQARTDAWTRNKLEEMQKIFNKMEKSDGEDDKTFIRDGVDFIEKQLQRQQH